MLDITLRPVKDRIFDPICDWVPSYISPTQITIFAFLCGLLSCAFSGLSSPSVALTFWVLNRALDCLDGTVARRRGQASDFGGFLDLLLDFIVYSLIPISCAAAVAVSQPDGTRSADAERTAQLWLWLPVALLEASFHINNFVLFYVAAVVEKNKRTATGKDDEKSVKELTSVAMRPALVEGAESGLMFTAMLAWPQYVGMMSWMMAGLVVVGTVQRVSWLIPTLG